MASRHALVLSGIMLVVSVVPARADGFITPFYGYNYGGNANCATVTDCEDRRGNFGVSLGSMGPVFGAEQDFAYSKDFFGKMPGAESSVWTLMSNALVGVGVGRVQPYVLFGFGIIRPHTSLTVGAVTQSFSKRAFGYDYGAGVNGYFTKSVGLRADVRRMRTFTSVPFLSGDEKLEFWRASLGLAFRF